MRISAALTNLDGLSALTSVVDNLWIDNNAVLTNLDGLGGITSIGGIYSISDNDILPDCEACEVLDQLTSVPIVINVFDNLNDSCTPVPYSCP